MQAAVESTFMELMHWVQYSDRVQHAASTPVLAAAVFTIALQAHQVCVQFVSMHVCCPTAELPSRDDSDCLFVTTAFVIKASVLTPNCPY